jgi:hypothetical protein
VGSSAKGQRSLVLLAILTLGLVIFSSLFLMGVGVGVFYVLGVFWPHEPKKSGAIIGVAIFSFAVYLLKYPWNALFKFSGSEVQPHGLPKKPEDEMPDDGPEQKEG